MSDFAQLHIHGIHSRLDGIASSNDYAKKAVKLGHSHLAITDHGHANGFFQLQQACNNHNLKPIFGIESYINDELVSMSDDNKKERRIRAKDKHLILLAKNKQGYENLLYLNWLSMSDNEHFYYNPRITTQEVFDHMEGLLVGSACINSPFGALMRKGQAKEALELILHFKKMLQDRFYLEIQINELTHDMDSLKEGQKTYNNIMILASKKFNIPLVLTGDVHYAEPGQDELQTNSIAIRNKDTMNNITFELESKNLYYHGVEDYLRFNKEFSYNYNEKDIIEWCKNSTYIAEQTSYSIEKRKKMYLPSFSSNDNVMLEEHAKAGLVEKLKVADYESVPVVYRERLERELEVIERKGFSSYFLIFEDIYSFVKKEGYLTGSSRGCFTPENKVRMKDGTLKNIEAIQRGEEVFTALGSVGIVEEVFEYDVEEDIIEIECEDGTIISLTDDHKVLVKRNKKNEWVAAKDIIENDEIVKMDPLPCFEPCKDKYKGQNSERYK